MKLPVAILAGGMATRLGPLASRVPKSLMDVAGKPFAVHQLELLAERGIERVIFCIGHLGDQIVSALGNGREWNIQIEYVFDGAVRLGTGGALRNAAPRIGECFLVLYGDSYLDCDYGEISDSFLASGKLGLMTVFRNRNQWDNSNILYRDGKIVFYDKTHQTLEMEHIDAGLGALRAEALSQFPVDRPFDLTAVYTDLISRGQMAGVELKGRFYEIGSVNGLQETSQYLGSRTSSNSRHHPE